MASWALQQRKRRRPNEWSLPSTPEARERASNACHDHACRVLSNLAVLRQSGQLCDLEIRSGDCVIRAHKCVLASASEYFSSCLTTAMQESQNGIVNLDGIEGPVLEALVSFSYTGKINVSEASVLEVLVAANRLSMHSVVRQCGDFLLARMDAANALGIYGLASTYCIHSLRSRAEVYIHRNFDKVSESQEFLTVPFEQLHELLCSEALSVAGEHVPYEAAVRWLRHDLPARRAHAAALFGCVRLQLLSPVYLADRVQTCDLVQNCPEAAPMILAAYQWHCGDASKRTDVAAFVRRRAVRPTIYAVGGDDGHDDRNPFWRVLCLHQQLGTWVEVAPLGTARSVCGVAICGGRLYACGGYDGERALDTVEAFDPASDAWTRLAPMAQRRCSCVCAELNGDVYAVGGVCGPVALRDVEKYDAAEDKWSSVAPMGEGRSGCGVAVLDGLLYAIGGINGAGETVSSGECFNPATQAWTPIQSLYHPRRSFGLAMMGGQLYACGGNDGVFDLSSVEAYDPATNRWRFVPSMRRRRMYCSVGVVGETLYAVGGLELDQTLYSVERFGRAANEWTEAPPLPLRLCGCGVGVLDCVPAQLASPNGGGGGSSGAAVANGLAGAAGAGAGGAAAGAAAAGGTAAGALEGEETADRESGLAGGTGGEHKE